MTHAYIASYVLRLRPYNFVDTSFSACHFVKPSLPSTSSFGPNVHPFMYYLGKDCRGIRKLIFLYDVQDLALHASSLQSIKLTNVGMQNLCKPSRRGTICVSLQLANHRGFVNSCTRTTQFHPTQPYPRPNFPTPPRTFHRPPTKSECLCPNERSHCPCGVGELDRKFP